MSGTEKERNYVVSWVIDLDASDPTEAAKEAQKIMLDPESWATNFEVQDRETGSLHQVDLSLEHGEEDDV